jgi:hypothetical protein
MGLFGAHFRWLLLEASWLRSSEEALHSLNLLLNSDLMIGRRVSGTGFSVTEVYKRGPNEDLIRRLMGVWQTDAQGVESTLSPIVSVRRMNIQKSVLKAVMVVSIFLNFPVAYFSIINFLYSML